MPEPEPDRKQTGTLKYPQPEGGSSPLSRSTFLPVRPKATGKRTGSCDTGGPRRGPRRTPVAAVGDGGAGYRATGPKPRLPTSPRWVRERDFQAAVMELARLLGWRVYHTWDSRKSEPGFPDLVLVRDASCSPSSSHLEAGCGEIRPPG